MCLQYVTAVRTYSIFLQYVPIACAYSMCVQSVPTVCTCISSYSMCLQNVPTVCIQYVPTVCACSVYLQYVHLWYLLTVCAYSMCLQYVLTVCAYSVYPLYVPTVFPLERTSYRQSPFTKLLVYSLNSIVAISITTAQHCA